MVKMEDNIYKNKYAVRSAIGIIQILNKINKIRDAEYEKFKPELEKHY
jgi:hypothetical protein